MTQRKLLHTSSQHDDGFWKATSELAISINNASIDGIIALDTNLNIITCNTVIEQWSGKLCDDIVGKPFFDIFPTAQNIPALRDALHLASEGLRSFVPSDPGFYFLGHFETHIVPLRDCSGNITGILQIIHDVSHRVKAENQLKELHEQLLQQYTELQYANEEMAAFAKIAAHDLKEPVRKIYMYAEYIKRNEAGKLSDTGKGYFRRIQTSIQRMGLLMDDVVNFLSLGAAKNEIEKVDLTELLSKIIDDFWQEIHNFGAKIHFEKLPVISGHKLALEQLLKQLIANALKFKKNDVPPEITISCDKVKGKDIPYDEARKNENYFCLSFEDNGIGFAPEHSNRIFDLFEQLHPHGIYKGNGKGLAIALKATRMHKGFMKAESEPGRGSIFYCFIPTSICYINS